MIGKELSALALWKDRAQRHGLYYAIKCIEQAAPPKIIINSFWRSGSTFLLELMANATGMRPYFEPVTPREPACQFLYKHRSGSFNFDRLHPDVGTEDIAQLRAVFHRSKFQSKWVYQNANVHNFVARQGKVLKLVTGAHILPHLQNDETKIIHLKREILDVVQSFVNSAWTKRFFEGVDLRYLLNAKDPEVALFYAPFKDFLKLDQFSFHQGIAIYKTLTDAFVAQHAPRIKVVQYSDLRQDPLVVMQTILKDTGIVVDEEKLLKWHKKPSRMTVFNQEKRNLNPQEIQEIESIIATLKPLLPTQ